MAMDIDTMDIDKFKTYVEAYPYQDQRINHDDIRKWYRKNRGKLPKKGEGYENFIKSVGTITNFAEMIIILLIYLYKFRLISILSLCNDLSLMNLLFIFILSSKFGIPLQYP